MCMDVREDWLQVGLGVQGFMGRDRKKSDFFFHPFPLIFHVPYLTGIQSSIT